MFRCAAYHTFCYTIINWIYFILITLTSHEGLRVSNRRPPCLHMFSWSPAKIQPFVKSFIGVLNKYKHHHAPAVYWALIGQSYMTCLKAVMPLIRQYWYTMLLSYILHWHHNERDGVPNHRRFDGLLNRWFRHRSKKTSKLRVTGLCEGNTPVTGEFPSQRASNAENVSIWWRHHAEIRCVIQADYVLSMYEFVLIALEKNCSHTEGHVEFFPRNSKEWTLQKDMFYLKL